ncbi:BPTI/Kunitz domain-containing protein-like [Haliotis rufescens]|uniref:BPTI/Kunitz domain-containing protein-like n=1 Tax=Haliotis rufescens TaxID=6454 RepID=UPI001EAFDC22|nr:BPTI/Kunitz domain-containing protein-like [Haliotis rufescens]
MNRRVTRHLRNYNNMSVRATSLVVLLMGLLLPASAIVPKNVCHLPKVVGPCYAAMPRYYFDYKTGACKKFIYGGCHGNANNFYTLHECRAACGGYDLCRQLPDSGHCYANFPRWFYDQFSGTCRPFTYGGCGGNCNNFLTRHECQFQCY